MHSLSTVAPSRHTDDPVRILTDCINHLPADLKGPISIALPLGELSGLGIPRLHEGDFFLASPSTQSSLLGRGRALDMYAQGQDRLRSFSRHTARIRRHWHFQDPYATGLKPLWFTTFAFDPADPMTQAWSGIPNATLVLPELLLKQDEGRARLILSSSWDGTDPQRVLAHWLDLIDGLAPHGRISPSRPFAETAPGTGAPSIWHELARLALEEFDRGRLDKLVLYRKQTLKLSQPVSPEGLASGLQQAFPDCRVIVLRQAGTSLISASPERLLSKRGLRISSDVLAGTASRSSDPETDRQLARQLLESDKTRREHTLVEQAIQQSLAPLCRRLQRCSQPEIRRLRNVQHLYLKLHGQLKADRDLLGIAAHLHPTPAVNGSPTQPALDWLRKHGQANRGWYCGASGWMDWDGDGELDVLLRCALLRGHWAELYAGAGLVTGSDPRAELEETELKLTAVRHYLSGP